MNRQSFLFTVLFLIWSVCLTAQDNGYDPLTISKPGEINTVDFTIQDESRSRSIPIRVYLPQDKSPQAVVLYSHGLGGSCKNNPYLGNHWAGRGYISVFVQHPGSDTSVWEGKPRAKRLAAMHQAASVENFMLRVKDIPAVIDQLTIWNNQEGHVLYKRLNLDRLGMSGHSFGASTTQAVSGQRYGRGFLDFTDSRIKAAVMFSPSIPKKDNKLESSFVQVKIPWMLMTGTLDKSFIATFTVKDRTKIFPVLPPGGKYEVVLYKAEHSAFADHSLPGDTEPKNPNHHQAIKALSTAFWDAWLNENPEARKWLDGKGATSILEDHDTWRRK
jgi:predicted dienelactone hydrolase